MATYVTPINRTTGDLITAAIWNQDNVENMKANSAELVTTKGDTVAATGAKTLERVPIGADGEVFTAASGESSGVAWASLPQGVPVGVITMWSGLLSNIPSGWALCDGNGGTPNLLDRFIVSVPTAGTDPGTTGGSDTHQHAAAGSAGSAGAHSGHGSGGAGGHGWSGSNGAESSHIHAYSVPAPLSAQSGAGVSVAGVHVDVTAGGSSHTHSASGAVSGGHSHSHTSSGGAHSGHGTHQHTAGNNDPKFFTLAYIIKT